MMLGLALSLIFSVLSWKESLLLSILVPVISLFFLSDKREKNRNIFYISLVFLLILEAFEYVRGVSYDLAETYLVVSFIFLVVSDFVRKRVTNVIFMAVFWFFVSLSLWKVASVKYPGASYLVFPAVAFIFLRDVFRRERDGREVRLSPMKELWTEEAKYRRWLEVELAVMKAYEELGTIPKGVTERVRNKARIDVELFKKIEERTNHDVVAFVEGIGTMIGEDSRFFHYGLTSSDVLDTANSLALVEAGKILLDALKKLCDVLWNTANRYRYTPTIGRTHGVHAEPTSFGLKVLGWYSEMKRNVLRLERAIEEVSYGKISGAVGNYANVPPEVEERALSYLGLKAEPVSTQVVPRDRHAHYLATLGIIAAGIERIAVEIRHLQRTEVLEVEEPFKEGQRGSSAMPHKKNPITCERLTGLSRMMRAFVEPALENVALWHERDISHSSVERYIFPDATQTLYYMIVTATKVIRDMRVNEEKMKKNLNLTKGLVFSQRVLLKLIEKGLTRKEAYDIVQRNALKTWESEKHFLEHLLEDEEVKNSLPKRN